MTKDSMKLQVILDTIVAGCWDPFYLHQGLVEEIEGREFMYNGGAFAPNYLDHTDVYVIYYKDIFFICTENFILFFEEERLADYLNGSLDEFMGLFPQNYDPIVYESAILEMSQYFVDKKSLLRLAESLQSIEKEKRQS